MPATRPVGDPLTLVKDEATSDARRVLEVAWDETLPVDPVKIGRSFGVRVVERDLDENLSGALVKERGHDPVILLNAVDSSNRKRFTCAHEIGHFIRRSDAPEEYEYVDRRDELATQGTDLEEIYANTFAAALLMPESHVRRFHDAKVAPFEMAWLFDVSQEAMQIRLSSLGLK
jgi:Zn-dependent peptidase ImmA (M78 family)